MMSRGWAHPGAWHALPRRVGVGRSHQAAETRREEGDGFRRCPEGLVSRTDRDREAGGGSNDVHGRPAPSPRPARDHAPDHTPDTADPAGDDVVSALPGPASRRAPQRVGPGDYPSVGAFYQRHGLRGPDPRKTVEQL